jgi:hypothetical protein
MEPLMVHVNSEAEVFFVADINGHDDATLAQGYPYAVKG